MLYITDPECKKYWLYILIPVNYELKDLDDFLKGIWLECCGHLSRFKIDDIYYYDENFYMDDTEDNMNETLNDVLNNDSVFTHEYDMGDTTTLIINVLKKICVANDEIHILSRNADPLFRCFLCKKFISNKLCAECYETFCEECSIEKKHKCIMEDDNVIIDLINSPRRANCFIGNFYPEIDTE